MTILVGTLPVLLVSLILFFAAIPVSKLITTGIDDDK